MISVMGPGAGSGAGASRAAGAGGVVARPGLFEVLGGSARVTVVSGLPGSGKTVLLGSWISATGVGDGAAWVAARRDERDPQRFWLSVLARCKGPGRGGHRGRRGAFDALLVRQCGVRPLAPFLLLAFLRGRNMDAKSKIGVCSGVGGPVRGVPLVGDGGSLGEVGDGLVVAAEEEG
jgi:hypothetical protein